MKYARQTQEALDRLDEALAQLRTLRTFIICYQQNKYKRTGIVILK
jgi:hypothetical protein